MGKTYINITNGEKERTIISKISLENVYPHIAFYMEYLERYGPNHMKIVLLDKEEEKK